MSGVRVNTRNRMNRWWRGASGSYVVMIAMGAFTQSAIATERVDFARDVQPIFAQHCVECHGPEKQASALRMDRRTNLLRGGDSAEPAIVPGDAGASYLLTRLRDPNPEKRMPYRRPPLAEDEIAIIERWISEGADWPGAEHEEDANVGASHWSLQPIQPLEPPTPSRPEWVRNAIDAFILAKLDEVGLEPSPEADRVTLIRRLCFDLHGLLPSDDLYQRYLNDRREDWYERLVEELLASPRYGERWAQHWLDVVRYGETSGFEVNTPRENAWPYRDYVIRAFNEDTPYDRFILEQLAGDAVGVHEATGLLVAAPANLPGQIGQDLASMLCARQDELAEIVTTIGAAYMGLTLHCARCHNHKFDPITLKDYYSLQAIFAGVYYDDRQIPDARDPVRLRELLTQYDHTAAQLQSLGAREPVNGRLNVESFTPRQVRFVRFTAERTNSGLEPCIDELEIWSVATGDAQSRNVALASAGAKATASGTMPNSDIHRLEHINDGMYGNGRSWISNELGRGWVQIELAEPTVIDRIIWGRDRDGVYGDRLALTYRIEVADDDGVWHTVADSQLRLPQDASAREAWLADAPADRREQIAQLTQRMEALTHELLQVVPPRRVFAGTFREPGPWHRLYRGDPMQKREEVQPDIPEIFGTLGLSSDTPEQQRRVALARWLGRKDNPLTARVMINRIWQHHFGTGFVDTPGDFGRMGTQPSHPELLDWLAYTFMERGWSIKNMHRLIVTSSTYRQAAVPHTRGLAVDSQSRLLWRYPARRLEAEPIRDSILQASGVLNLTMGGPGFNAFKPNDNYVRIYEPREDFGPGEWRRMIYMHRVRMEKDGVFDDFDRPDAGQVCTQRVRSTTALQALNLLNSTFMMQQSRLFAERLQREMGEDVERQITRAFQLLYGRSPEREELDAGMELVRSHGLVAFCRAIFSTSEFLMIP